MSGTSQQPEQNPQGPKQEQKSPETATNGKHDDKQQSPQTDKKKNKVDKLVMGAIIGVAVGSVVGMSMKDNDQQKSASKAAPEKKNKFVPKSRIGKTLERLFSGKKKKQILQKDMKKIPSETE